jgi:hypothetical protein
MRGLEHMWVAAALVLGACTSVPGDGPAPSGCPALQGDWMCGGDSPECRLSQVYADRAGIDSLRRLLSTEPVDQDDALRELMPFIGDKPFADGVLAAPATVVMHESNYDDAELSLPLDWTSDPYGQTSWVMYFQALSWTDSLDPDAAAAVIVDYADNALHLEPALRYGWGDHPMALRLGRTISALQRYADAHDVLDRRVVQAGAELVLTQLYAMACDACYGSQHNHGFMMDLTILESLGAFPALRDGEALWDLAERRLIDRQVALSSTTDGIHVENSLAYHSRTASPTTCSTCRCWPPRSRPSRRPAGRHRPS